MWFNKREAWFAAPPRSDKGRGQSDPGEGGGAGWHGSPRGTRVTSSGERAGSSALPQKLADCRSTDAERNRVVHRRGDSALGTA